MNHELSGRAVRIGDDVNTDLILPGAYLNLTEPEALGRHLLEGYDPELGKAVQPGDVLVAGKDFGAGSSREQAPIAMLARGVQAVVAASFARIFLRNALNLGLLVVESPEAVAATQTGDRLRIDLHAGVIERAEGGSFTFPPQTGFVEDLVEAGGLVPWVRTRLQERDGS
jgi:3-isopropylmalate/(R)-2-methylmalate dehydratase small subunit